MSDLPDNSDQGAKDRAETDAELAAETLAAKRYFLMNGARVLALMLLIFGIAIARKLVDAPYPLGVAFAVMGFLAFFFGPRAMAKRWKSAPGETGQ